MLCGGDATHKETEGRYGNSEGGRGLTPRGYLVFFLADSALFVAAGLPGTRTTDGGTIGVRLFWWSPSSKPVRDEASY